MGGGVDDGKAELVEVQGGRDQGCSSEPVNWPTRG